MRFNLGNSKQRIRLVQTFFLMGGFMFAITDDKFEPSLDIIFSVYLLFIILYLRFKKMFWLNRI